MQASSLVECTEAHVEGTGIEFVELARACISASDAPRSPQAKSRPEPACPGGRSASAPCGCATPAKRLGGVKTPRAGNSGPSAFAMRGNQEMPGGGGVFGGG
jgi:hypothetical protein